MALRNLNRSWPRGRICGTPKTGVLGSLIPATGGNGPGYAYGSLNLPTENNDQFQGYIDSVPGGLTLFAYEDTSFEASANDGSYTVPWTLYKNGVQIGSTTFTLVFGQLVLLPAAGALTLTGLAPTAVRTAHVTAAPAAGALAFTGLAPTALVTANQVASPGAGALAFASSAPAAQNGDSRTVQPSDGAAAIVGLVPVVQATAHRIVTPAAGAGTFSGLAPAALVSILTQPAAGAALISGLAPAVSLGIAPVTPAAGAALFVGLAPTVLRTTEAVAQPAARAVALTGFAPSAIVTGQVGSRAAQTTYRLARGLAISTGRRPRQN